MRGDYKRPPNNSLSLEGEGWGEGAYRCQDNYGTVNIVRILKGSPAECSELWWESFT